MTSRDSTTHDTKHRDEIPALLGGAPVWPEGPPRFDLADEEVSEVLQRLAQSGGWQPYHGPHVGHLVEALRASLRVEHVHLCCSGTAAIELALRSLGVGPGDEVLMSAYDFKANFTNITHLGALPVLIDVRSDDFQLQVEQLDEGRSPQTRAVIASHLHGGLVDMRALKRWSEQHHIPIIEDACQAPGAVVQGRPAGTWGDVGTFSFGGSKLVTAGRGGALFTQRADVAQRIKLLTQRGNDAYPLSEMQAAILLPQWSHLDGRNAHRRTAVDSLRKQLADINGLSIFSLTDPQHDVPAYYKVGLFYDPTHFEGLPKERFAAAMRAEGFALDPGFDLLHQIHARRRYRLPHADALPVAESRISNVLTLHHPVLSAPMDELSLFVSAVRKLQQNAGLLLGGAE
ncbi:MAG: DegT/DnrJ/EryC1/StrS family aminotransferase [Planctomycetaceae bacterium]